MNELKEEQEGTIKSFSTPRLNPEEKLYVRVYLHTLSHSKAYEAVRPGLTNYSDYRLDNIFSRRENVKYYISLGLQEKAEALTLSPSLILERLYKEAIREGSGSNHAARIQALTLLGKHLGLFEEKREDNSFTFNIINYSNEPTIKQDTEISEDTPKSIEAVTEDTDTDKLIKFTEYSVDEDN